ncbi:MULTISPECIES: hypothetical protein [unclassified Streptomyces]|uniref:hypothetical protein n=1 Tax=unclassified Streptomyces TaxID=2593676 RepID=UPI000DAD34DF|nr:MULTISPECIES: hypothetical protein [unclassified Streptomyces]PZT76439.1 hypothetical protein DNK56_24205 [Streptomyces sp. AC1-42W]PZT79604.1 hypothetical protein DNK55_08460 [Streptomyces sp. AC1-42T]
MTDQDHVTVNDPNGPVNNGSGPQNNYYGVGADWMRRKRVDTLRIVREDRVRLADRFARPAGYRVGADRLKRPGAVVLLEGEPGSGRRAAAIMLLHELGTEDASGSAEGRFEELPAMDKDQNPFAPAEGDRFLLDLSGIADEEEYAGAQRELDLRRSRVQEAGARMVAVLPAGLEYARKPDLEPYIVKLGRPRGVTVLTRHLRMDRMAFRPADLANPALQQLCDRSPMRELAQLARLVGEARDSRRFGSDFAGWLDQAIHAVTDRAGEVGRQVAEARSTPERALLLAAAVFEEARADTVYRAWRGLLRTVKYEDETTTELAGSDFGERLTALGIERDAGGRLRFGHLAYADAVRTYFWANFPGVRDDLRDWIGQAAGQQDLTLDDRVGIVVRFGECALAVDRPDHLFALAVQWANGSTGAHRDQRAVTALGLGLSHEGLGGWFRRKIYEYVRSGALSDGLVRVLTAACCQYLAMTHPDQALVRLHHLAVRNSGAAAREARDALFELSCRDRRLHRLLIDRLRERTRQEPRAAAPHLRLLAELLTSDRASDPPVWPDLFVGWEAVFAQPPTELWTSMVNSWLSSAAEESSREMALGVMVGATRGRPAALQRLYTLACDWVRTSHRPERSAVAGRFWRYIDDAQCDRAEDAPDMGAGTRTREEAR